MHQVKEDTRVVGQPGLDEYKQHVRPQDRSGSYREQLLLSHVCERKISTEYCLSDRGAIRVRTKKAHHIADHAEWLRDDEPRLAQRDREQLAWHQL